jgi:hypothetical protein
MQLFRALFIAIRVSNEQRAPGQSRPYFEAGSEQSHDGVAD